MHRYGEASLDKERTTFLEWRESDFLGVFMVRWLVFSLVLTLQAQAAHLDDVCKHALRGTPDQMFTSPPLFTEGLVAHSAGNGSYVVETLDGQLVVTIPARISAMAKLGDSLWALSGWDLVEFSLSTGEFINAYRFEANLNEGRIGRSMVLAGQTLVITQGMGGMTGFDTTTRTVRWKSPIGDVPGGMPVAVAFDGTHAQAVMATTGPAGFAGVATVDVANGKTLKTIAYNQASAGVIDPWAKASWHENSLVLNNGGWIHVVSAKQLAAGKPMRPRWVAEVIPANGRVNEHYMILLGEFFFRDNTLVGCGSYTADENGTFVGRSRLFEVAMP